MRKNQTSGKVRGSAALGATLLACAAGCALMADKVLASQPGGAGQSVVRRVLWQPLERRFERADIRDWRSVTGVVSLGGNPARVREAGRLARLHPHLRVVLADKPNAVRYLGGGIDPSRIEIEDRSSNTWENAVFSKRVAAPRPGERWLVITSAVHMPRAIGAFRQAGFSVEAWPVYDVTDPRHAYEAVRHEWLGLIGYTLRGRSSALFPRPQ